MALRSLASIVVVCLLAAAAQAGNTPQSSPSEFSGEWELTTMVFGQPLSERLTLKVDKGKITGSISGRSTPVSVKVDGNRVQFEYKDADGTNNVY